LGMRLGTAALTFFFVESWQRDGMGSFDPSNAPV